MKNVMLQLSLLPIVQLLAMVLSVCMVMAIVGYILFVKPVHSNWRALEQQTVSLQQKITVAQTTVQQNNSVITPTPIISSLKLLRLFRQHGLHSVTLNETEPITCNKFSMCQFAICGRVTFDDAVCLLKSLTFAGVKTFSLQKDEQVSPFLNLTMEVIGFCEPST